jgi:hypothetical protein
MRAVIIGGVLAVIVAFGACASMSDSSSSSELFLDLYWTASRQCEARYRTLHVDSIGVDGSLSLRADAESRGELASFRDCYWKAVRERADQRGAAGSTLPDNINLQPDVEID